MKRVNYPRIIGLSNDWQISWIHMLRGHEMLGRFPSSTGSGTSHSVWKNPKSLIFNFTLKITKITPWRKKSWFFGPKWEIQNDFTFRMIFTHCASDPPARQE